MRGGNQSHGGNRLFVLFHFLDVLLKLCNAPVAADGLELGGSRSQLVEGLEGGLTEPMEAEGFGSAIGRYDRLKASGDAPGTELTAKRIG